MTTQTVREDLVKTIGNLPLEALLEIAKYVEFWQFKQSQGVPTKKRKRANANMQWKACGQTAPISWMERRFR